MVGDDIPVSGVADEGHSKAARSLKKNPIRKIMAKSATVKGLISLGGGKPQPSTFPTENTLTVTLRDGSKGGRKVDVELDDMWALNYNGKTFSSGLPALQKWCAAHMARFHGPRCSEKKSGDDDGGDGGAAGDQTWATAISSGSTDAINKMVQMLTDPGDTILAAEYCYPGLCAGSIPQGRRVVGVEMDEHGISPAALAQAAADLRAKGVKCGFLYTVPVGQNPTGVTMPLERKREIYAVCQRHGLIIVEDDPYYFLQLPPTAAASAAAAGGARQQQQQQQQEEALPGTDTSKLVPSFLSMDVDGRVVRLDSFAKLMCPGYRIGWVTGPRRLIARLDTFSQVTTWSMSGIPQAILAGILDAWADKGFDDHVLKLQATYCERRDALLAALKDAFPPPARRGGSSNDDAALAEWTVPTGGMFVWLKVAGVEDASYLADAMIEAGVAMVPGAGFRPGSGKLGAAPSPYFRASFATADLEDFSAAAQRIATVLANRPPEPKREKQEEEIQSRGLRVPLLVGSGVAAVVAAAVVVLWWRR